MRIAFFGNVCNNYYQIAYALRTYAGIDAHLYINNNDHPQMKPESDDPSLKGNYPDWIHAGNYIHGSALLRPWKAEITEELRKYDIAVVSYLGPIFAQFTGKPTVFFVAGGDLSVTPFLWQHMSFFHGIRQKAPKVVVSFWQKRGVKHMSRIWRMSPLYENEIELLGVKDTARDYFMPLLIDDRKFVEISEEEAAASPDPNIPEIRRRFDFFVFHPTRIMIRATPQMKAKLQWKANDVLFEGFAEFLQRTGTDRAGLVMPERAASPDIDLAKEIISSLGIESGVYWAKPDRPAGFTRSELMTYYSLADAVADQYGPVLLSSVALEGMCMSRPVIMNAVPEYMQRVYGRNPVLSAATPADVADRLEKLYTSPEWKTRVGIEGRQFINEFHTREAGAAIWKKGFEDLLASR